MTKTFKINNREYPEMPENTSIVICLDGSQKEYLDEASKESRTPNLDRIIKKGEYIIVEK